MTKPVVSPDSKSDLANELTVAWADYYHADRDKQQWIYSLLCDLMDNTPPEIVAELLQATEVGT